MKRGLLLIIALLLVPIVTATIYTDSTLNQEYNLGDYIKLNGYVIQSQDMTGLLNIRLSCANETLQLAAKSMRIKAEQSESFGYALPVTGILTGNCKLIISLEDLNKTLIEQVETTSFDITKELAGNFDISSKEFQLGDELALNANIKNLNNENVNGMAIIYLRKDGVNYVVDTADISGGSLNYKTRLVSIPAGKYNVDVAAGDVKGNSQLFENILEFDLYDELIIAVKSDKTSYLPGDVLGLSGNVHKKTGPSVDNTKIKINFENYTTSGDVAKGQFLFNIPLSKTIKSYYHNLTLEVEDSDGNYGRHEIKIEIIPIPTSLEADFDKEGYIPEDNINIKVYLYDQARDILPRDMNFKITDVDKKIAYENTQLTTDEINYKLPQFALPGEWKLDIESEGLKLNKKIIVEAIEILDVDLLGQTLLIKNMGNELYDDKIEIDSDGIVKEQSVRLKPNETISIELYKLFDEGTHTIKVLGKTFDAVTIIDERNILEKGVDGLASITGYSAMKKYGNVPSILYLVLILIVLLVIISLIIQFGFKMNMKRKPDHERRKYDRLLGTKKADELKQKKKYDFKFGKADENDIKDFRKRMISSIDSQRKNTFRLPEKPAAQEKKGDDKGPFSMFN